MILYNNNMKTQLVVLYKIDLIISAAFFNGFGQQLKEPEDISEGVVKWNRSNPHDVWIP